MKKCFALGFVIVLLISLSGAVELDIKPNYERSESIIGPVLGQIASPISKEQVRLVRDGHLDVGVDYDVSRIGDYYYIWMISPDNPGNYTIKIQDMDIIESGSRKLIDFEKNFSVVDNETDYYVKPGFISAEGDFYISVVSNLDQTMQIALDKPVEENIMISPGENKLSFKIGDFNATGLYLIQIGKYSVPAYITVKDNNVPIDESLCGNGILNTGEECDGPELGGESCASLSPIYDSGDLECNPDCLGFNTDSCILKDASSVVTPPLEPTVTGPLSFDFVTETVRFVANPGTQTPAGKFMIKNTGSVPLNKISFSYNPDYFLVEPTNGFSIPPGETFEFNISLKEIGDTKPFRDILIARVGEQAEYIFLSVEFTDNEKDVGVDVFDGVDNQDPVVFCSDLGGVGCKSDETCDGEFKETYDNAACCIGTCAPDNSGGGGGSNAWIGYLIAGIVILILLIIYVKYKKTGSKGKGINERFKMAEKNLP